MDPCLIYYAHQVDIIDIHCPLTRPHTNLAMSDGDLYGCLGEGGGLFLDVYLFYHLEFFGAGLFDHKHIVPDVA
jgi:hypothetical protein